MNFEDRKRQISDRAEKYFSTAKHFDDPRWRSSLEAVWRILPRTKETIPKPWNLVTDSVIEAALEKNPALSLQRIPRWEEFEFGNEIYSKEELFDLIIGKFPALPGEVFIVPHYAFSEGSPFAVASASLRDSLIADPHFIFDSDALFIWPEANAIVVLHHSGFYLRFGEGV